MPLEPLVIGVHQVALSNRRCSLKTGNRLRALSEKLAGARCNCARRNEDNLYPFMFHRCKIVHKSINTARIEIVILRDDSAANFDYHPCDTRQ
jgi:hypothetical protein